MASVPIVVQPKDYYGKLSDYAYFYVVTNQINADYQWQYSANDGVTWNSTTDTTSSMGRPITTTRLTYLFRCRIQKTGYDTTYTDTVRMILESDALMVTLQTNSSETVQLDKTLADVATLPCYLRDSCSLQNPVLLLEADLHELIDVNYATIPQFGRSYFVSPPVSVRDGLVELSLHVDVLSSFKSQIRANTGVVRRAESEVFNLYINDGSLIAYQDPYILTEPFPNGFTGAGFILAVAGA